MSVRYRNPERPAFPVPLAGCTDGGVYNTMEQSSGQLGGLTKREYIATLALQGILTHGHNDLTYESVVRDAVVYADELLKELAK